LSIDFIPQHIALAYNINKNVLKRKLKCFN